MVCGLRFVLRLWLWLLAASLCVVRCSLLAAVSAACVDGCCVLLSLLLVGVVYRCCWCLAIVIVGVV